MGRFFYARNGLSTPHRRWFGTPETIRTSDLPLRRGMLYPAELPGQRNTGRSVCRRRVSITQPPRSGRKAHATQARRPASSRLRLCSPDKLRRITCRDHRSRRARVMTRPRVGCCNACCLRPTNVKKAGRAGLWVCGAEEDRTPDLRIANATLSQLSYRPNEAGSLPSAAAHFQHRNAFKPSRNRGLHWRHGRCLGHRRCRRHESDRAGWQGPAGWHAGWRRAPCH